MFLRLWVSIPSQSFCSNVRIRNHCPYQHYITSHPQGYSCMNSASYRPTMPFDGGMDEFSPLNLCLKTTGRSRRGECCGRLEIAITRHIYLPASSALSIYCEHSLHLFLYDDRRDVSNGLVSQNFLVNFDNVSASVLLVHLDIVVVLDVIRGPIALRQTGTFCK